MIRAKLVTITPDAEQLIAFCARVSNPPNQKNKDYVKLLKYCMRNQHWSIFEMANMVVEVECSRAIGRQLLRHKTFCFQEFSQRYSSLLTFEKVELRKQDPKNRQNSLEVDLFDDSHEDFSKIQEEVIQLAMKNYTKLFQMGVANECARAILPEGLTNSTMYVNGNIRTWIHYLQLRRGNGTQKEHRILANKIYEIFKEHLPTIASCMEDPDIINV